MDYATASCISDFWKAVLLICCRYVCDLNMSMVYSAHIRVVSDKKGEGMQYVFIIGMIWKTVVQQNN